MLRYNYYITHIFLIICLSIKIAQRMAVMICKVGILGMLKSSSLCVGKNAFKELSWTKKVQQHNSHFNEI